MRIALLTYSTRPRGSVVHTLALAEALAELGEEVTVYALEREGTEGLFRAVAPEVDVELVCVRRSDDLEERVLRSIAALSAAVDVDAHDVLHAQDCIAANAVPGCTRTVHHLDHFTSPALVRCHDQAIVRPRSHVCVSEGVEAELRAGWGIDARVIPNGVHAPRFEAAAGPGGAEDRAKWRRRLGDGPLVLTVGGIEPRKGSIELLEAVARLRKRRPDARLVVAGGETLFDYRDYRAAFDERRAELRVDVAVLGPVEDDALPSLVACADVFALPSVKEGFGLAAMEALAAGVPVVLREGPVLREVFGGTALFGKTSRELGEHLVAALGEPAAGRRERGRALAASHTWEAAARAHLEFYRGLPREAALVAMASAE